MSLRARIARRLMAFAGRRPPDFIIGGPDKPYLRRWWLLPRNRWFNVYLHQFCRSDDDRALHDHPWLFNASWLLDGSYIEQTAAGRFVRNQGAFKLRLGPAPHRVELLRDYGCSSLHNLFISERPCWTLFITGPRVREWGFACPNGWRHWALFTSPLDKGQIGRGCD